MHYFTLSAYSCLFFRKRKVESLRERKILDHGGIVHDLTSTSGLVREPYGKGTLCLPLVLLHAQLKSTFKVKRNIISNTFSSATWKGIRDPVVDQFKLCPFGRLPLSSGKCKTGEWKFKGSEKNHALCQNLLFLWSSVCCLLSWDCLQRVHGILKKTKWESRQRFPVTVWRYFDTPNNNHDFSRCLMLHNLSWHLLWVPLDFMSRYSPCFFCAT